MHVSGSYRQRVFPSLIDAELTSYRPLPNEARGISHPSDKLFHVFTVALIDMEILKADYTEIKQLSRNVRQFRSRADNVMIAVKMIPHQSLDFVQQRENYNQIRILKFVRSLFSRSTELLH